MESMHGVRIPADHREQSDAGRRPMTADALLTTAPGQWQKYLVGGRTPTPDTRTANGDIFVMKSPEPAAGIKRTAGSGVSRETRRDTASVCPESRRRSASPGLGTPSAHLA